MAGGGFEVALVEPLAVEDLLMLPLVVFLMFIPAPALAETVMLDLLGAMVECEW